MSIWDSLKEWATEQSRAKHAGDIKHDVAALVPPIANMADVFADLADLLTVARHHPENPHSAEIQAEVLKLIASSKDLAAAVHVFLDVVARPAALREAPAPPVESHEAPAGDVIWN